MIDSSISASPNIFWSSVIRFPSNSHGFCFRLSLTTILQQCTLLLPNHDQLGDRSIVNLAVIAEENAFNETRANQKTLPTKCILACHICFAVKLAASSSTHLSSLVWPFGPVPKSQTSSEADIGIKPPMSARCKASFSHSGWKRDAISTLMFV